MNQIKLGELVGTLKYFRSPVSFDALNISAAEYIKLEIMPMEHGNYADLNSSDAPIRSTGVRFGELNQLIYYYSIIDFEHEQMNYPIFIHSPITIELSGFFKLLFKHFDEYIGKLRKQLVLPSIEYETWTIHMKFFETNVVFQPLDISSRFFVMVRVIPNFGLQLESQSEQVEDIDATPEQNQLVQQNQQRQKASDPQQQKEIAMKKPVVPVAKANQLKSITKEKQQDKMQTEETTDKSKSIAVKTAKRDQRSYSVFSFTDIEHEVNNQLGVDQSESLFSTCKYI